MKIPLYLDNVDETYVGVPVKFLDKEIGTIVEFDEKLGIAVVDVPDQYDYDLLMMAIYPNRYSSIEIIKENKNGTNN